MNDDALKDYQRQFALASLRKAGKELTSNEIAEQIQINALVEGHPDACWRSMSPPSVAGHMRSLEKAGDVVRCGARSNGRAGRDEPTWKPVAGYDPKAEFPLPLQDAPSAPPAPVRAAAPPPDASPYADLTRPQLYALLEVHDDISSLLVRFLRDFQEVRMKAHRILDRADLEVTPE
jgi:hypothetical protein